MRWPLTFYVKTLPPKVGGRANGPVIRILESYRDDEGIYQHELVHVKQWLRTLGLHGFMYLLSDSYKLRAEVEAYREQARYYSDDRIPMFAGFIAENYELTISPEEALKELRK